MLDASSVVAAAPFRPHIVSVWEAVDSGEAALQSWPDFRALWCGIPDAARDSFLQYLYDKFCTFGYIGMRHRDGFIENEQGKEILAHCAGHPIGDWTDQGLALASTFWLFESAGVLMTEWNQRLLEPGLIAELFRAKLAGYRALAGVAGAPVPDGLVALCREVQRARAAIPATYVRSFSIDGMTWEREERYLDGRRPADTVHSVVAEEIRTRLGVALPEASSTKESFEKLVDLLTANGVNPFEILVAIVQAAVRDDVLQADFAVVTVPQGKGLDAPWNLTQQDVCSYAVVRDGFDPQKEGIEFQQAQIVRAIERRMRFNTWCRSKNYHPERETRRKAQPFQFPDIAHGESSHHAGHIKSGIKTSARTHFEIRIPALAQYGDLRGFGDFRVNRADDSPARRYTFEELTHLLPYGQWCKTVFDHAIANRQSMDAKYCLSA